MNPEHPQHSKPPVSFWRSRTGLLLNPMIASAAMAMSSVTVVSNANRLRFFNAYGTPLNGGV